MPISSLRPSNSRPLFRSMAMSLLLALWGGGAYAHDDKALRSIVFYYGDDPVVRKLQKFDIAVVEPDTRFVPPSAGATGTRWFAYVSVGEVHRTRGYHALIPQGWIVGKNNEWNSDIVDQAAVGWPEFFVEHIITPLWKKGYRGFFLDTLDSYLLVSGGELERLHSRSGLVAAIRAIRIQYPEASLIINRGFELLPALHDDVYAVAFESLFKGWSEAKGQYYDVPEVDRQWLMERVREVKQKYRLPVISIDYCAPTHYQCSKETVERIRALGLVPYVGDGRLFEINESVLD